MHKELSPVTIKALEMPVDQLEVARASQAILEIMRSFPDVPVVFMQNVQVIDHTLYVTSEGMAPIFKNVHFHDETC